MALSIVFGYENIILVFMDIVHLLGVKVIAFSTIKTFLETMD